MFVRRPSAIVAGQLLAVVAAFAVLALWPPQRGAMLLISASGDPVEAINVAVAGGAALVGQGPLPGSMIVSGDRARVSARIGRHAMLLVAAPAAGCRAPLADGSVA